MTAGKKVIINTETTGFSPKEWHKLVEIAAIAIDENDIQTGAVFYAYINPAASGVNIKPPEILLLYETSI